MTGGHTRKVVYVYGTAEIGCIDLRRGQAKPRAANQVLQALWRPLPVHRSGAGVYEPRRWARVLLIPRVEKNSLTTYENFTAFGSVLVENE